MKKRLRKWRKPLTALVIVAALVGAIWGASVLLQADVLMFGEAGVSCDDSIEIGWEVNRTTGLLTAVRLSDIHPDCAGYNAYVSLLDDVGVISELGGMMIMTDTLAISAPGIPIIDIEGVTLGIW